MFRTKTIVTVCGFLIFFVSITQAQLDESLKKEVNLSIRNGLKFLEKDQQDDGSWSHYPAITALAVTAFLKSPLDYNESNSLAVARGMQFVLGNQKPDGGIYSDEMQAYNTSICLSALVAAKNPKYDNAIRRARDFLISLQFDEEEGYTPANILYGGIGYNDDGTSDLSNLEWALQALKDSENFRKASESSGKPLEYSGTSIASSKKSTVGVNKELFWEKAIIFIQRCQNFKKTNDRPWTGNDGGFIYSPSESKAGEYTSYGSMTYAGMKSMVYAGLAKDDERVQAAYNWIKKNYSLEVNPQLGKQGLYYYYHTFAKSLSAFGDEILADASGVNHNWRKEFAEKMLSIQKGEGYWSSENNRWWENNKDLATSYILLGLEQIITR